MTAGWSVLVIALWLAVLLLTALMLGLLSRMRDLSDALEQVSAPRASAAASRVQGPAVGSVLEAPAPSRSPAPSRRGDGARRDRIVLFLSFSCAPCHQLGDELKAAQEDGFEFVGTDLVIVTDELGATFYRELGPDEIVVQATDEVARGLGINATPYGIAVDADGIVRWSGIASDFDDVVSMIAACNLGSLGEGLSS